MSETLSTLIAFVGFLVVLSMLVQSLQEGLKNLLKLKTGVYERFFINLYKQDFFKPPKNSDQTDKQRSPWKTLLSLKEKFFKLIRGSKQSTNEAQAKPRSFWEILRSGEFVGEFDKRMSRLKKVIDQAGGILRETKDALDKFAANLHISVPAPSSPEEEKKKLIEENKKIIEENKKKLEDSLKPVMNSLAKLTALRLDLVLNIFDQFKMGEINNLYANVSKFTKSCNHLLDNKNWSEAQNSFTDELLLVLSGLDKVKRMISDYRLQIEGRMDAWLAQLNEVYRRNMLKWTVAIGAVIVFIFNADAFTIYRYLATHDVARAVISQKVEGRVVQAQKVKPEDLNRINELISQRKTKEAKELILTFATNLADDFRIYKAEDKAKEAAQIKKEAEKIKADSPDEKVIESLGTKTGELAKLHFYLQKSAFDQNAEMLTSLGLPLGWVEDWSRLKLLWTETKNKSSEDNKDKGEVRAANAPECGVFLLRKIGGLILTIFLITFGAPFWNDILSALTGFKNKTVKEGKPGEP